MPITIVLNDKTKYFSDKQLEKWKNYAFKIENTLGDWFIIPWNTISNQPMYNPIPKKGIYSIAKEEGFVIDENGKILDFNPPKEVNVEVSDTIITGNSSIIVDNIKPNYYNKYKITPLDFILANDLQFIEGCVVKYICRWRDKNGVEDLKKAKEYIEILIKNEENGA